MISLLPQVFQFVYANDFSSYVPSLWANESLLILEESMVAANLVHRDFQDVISGFGDTVNTRKPADFTMKRKVPTDSVTVQDATATNVQVKLDQHMHTSFLVEDANESKSFKDLVTEFLRPAMISLARGIDKVILGQAYQFAQSTYVGGHLGGLTTTNAQAYLLETRQVLNQNKAPVDDRSLILTPTSETNFLNTGLFVQAQQVGDQGQALRDAALGRKFGLDIYMCQNMPSVVSGNTTANGAINNGAGYPAGYAGAMTVDLFAAAVTVGTWVTIGNDDRPVQVSAASGSPCTSLTLVKPLKRAVADDAVITALAPGAVNLVAGYAAGWSKEIVVDLFTVAPQVGQLVSFGTDTTNCYSIIAVTSTTGITLDRPLVAAIADDDAVNLGPAGEYNLAFHKNAIALVVRPLATPKAGTGALSAVANYNGLSMRTTITYDGNRQGHLVTLDLLCGIKVLDPLLGAVLLG